MKSAACVPIDEREENVVDILRRTTTLAVAHIQATCVHEFRLTEEIPLCESKTGGVWIIYEYAAGGSRFLVQCLTCSKKDALPFKEICPRCLHALSAGDLVDRQTYLSGKEIIKLHARLYHCTQCGFQGVGEEL